MSLSKTIDVASECRQFCNELSDLLNGTVSDGVKVTCVAWKEPHPRAVVGYGLQKDDQTNLKGVRLALGRKKPLAYLGLVMRLEADHEQRHLMVKSSVMILALDEGLEDVLLHYDYEREKEDGYPEAHVQIHADSPGWQRVGSAIDPSGRGRALERLHLPVGPRRFRPSVEDIIEFVIREGLAEGRDDWKAVLDASRETYRVRQLKAAIRRDPDTAIAALKAAGKL